MNSIMGEDKGGSLSGPINVFVRYGRIHNAKGVAKNIAGEKKNALF